MIDLVCAEILYLCFLLCCFGLDLGLFTIVSLLCAAKIGITIAKLICGHQIEYRKMPSWWSKYATASLLTAPLFCLMLTFFSGTLYIYIAFLIVVLMEAHWFRIIKHSSIRYGGLACMASAYGLILAEWYIRNPLENCFGNRNFAEPLCILLSSVVALIPFGVVEINNKTSSN